MAAVVFRDYRGLVLIQQASKIMPRVYALEGKARRVYLPFERAQRKGLDNLLLQGDSLMVIEAILQERLCH